MTEKIFEKAQSLFTQISALSSQLQKFEKQQSTQDFILSSPTITGNIFRIEKNSDDIFNQICKDELTAMMNNIKNRIRAEINKLETEFQEL